MNLTSDVKKEIVSRGVAEKTAGLSAFIRASATMGISEGNPTFFVVSETENVAEFFTSSFEELFGEEIPLASATQDRLSGRDKLVFICPTGLSAKVLQALHLLKRTGGIRENIPQTLLKADESKISYIQGAFLGGGSCTLPVKYGTGYHLEIVFAENYAYAAEVEALPLTAQKNIRISKQRLPIGGGFILRGVKSDKDVSYEALLTADREEYQADLAKKLFP